MVYRIICAVGIEIQRLRYRKAYGTHLNWIDLCESTLLRVISVISPTAGTLMRRATVYRILVTTAVLVA